jgi:hypothetical protein
MCAKLLQLERELGPPGTLGSGRRVCCDDAERALSMDRQLRGRPLCSTRKTPQPSQIANGGAKLLQPPVCSCSRLTPLPRTQRTRQTLLSQSNHGGPSRTLTGCPRGRRRRRYRFPIRPFGLPSARSTSMYSRFAITTKAAQRSSQTARSLPRLRANISFSSSRHHRLQGICHRGVRLRA